VCSPSSLPRTTATANTTQVVHWVEPLLSGDTPVPRKGAAAATTAGCIVMFGGTANNAEEQPVVLDELVVFAVQGAAGNMSCRVNPNCSAAGPAPSARTGATLLEHAPGQLLLYGGISADGRPLDDAFELDVDALTWRKVFTGHPDLVGQEGGWDRPPQQRGCGPVGHDGRPATHRR
jgi:dynein heavy chain